jgi:glycosyltransferase involved in cell wall biosynthesis
MDDRHVALVISHNGDGGSQILWENLADGLSARGYHPLMISLYQPKLGGTRPRWKPLVKRELSPGDIPSVTWKLAAELRKVRPLATISALPAANALSAVAGAIAGVRTRITTHHTPSQTYGALIRNIEKRVGCTAATTVAVSVSRGVQQSFNDYPLAYRSKMRVIRNALSPTTVETITAIRHAATSNANIFVPKRILAAGRLSEQKNYPTLIAAMKDVTGCRLYIAGDGPDRRDLEALVASYGLSEIVHFLGHKTHSEVLQLMGESDVFVQPSLYEGHSIALLEAAAFGLPLVVSDAETQVEAITSATGNLLGLIAPRLNSSTLAERINALVSDNALRAKMSHAAFTLSEEWEFSKLVDSYEGLIV